MYRAERFYEKGVIVEGCYVGSTENAPHYIIPPDNPVTTGFVRIIFDTLEIKIGGHWFKPDEADRLVDHAKWMLGSIDYGNAQTGLVLKDQPEVKDLREILAEKE